MRVPQVVSAHRWLSFALGIVVVQSFVVLFTFYLRTTTPALANDAEPSSTLAMVEESELLTENTKNIAPPKEEVSAIQDTSPVEDPRQAMLKPEIAENLKAEELKEEKEIEPPSQKLKKTPQHIAQYTVRSGDTLTNIWRKHGDSTASALRAAAALREAGVKLSEIRAGDKLEIGYSSPDKNEIAYLKKRLSQGRTLILEKNDAENYTATVIEPEVIELEKTASATILHSLAEAAETQAIPYPIVDELVDVFGGALAFRRDIQPGDVFSVIYKEKVTAHGERLGTVALEAASIRTNGKTLSAVRHIDEKGKAHYYDQEGEPMGNFFLRYPVKFTRISSMYSHNRMHPVLKIRRPHHGVDFAAPVGTPVRAVADGRITFAGYSGGAGRMIKVSHGDRYSSAYLHLSKILVRKGTYVERGDVIGRVGSTGLSTGPHLDFRLYDRGRAIDPLKCELPRMPQEHNPIPSSFLRARLKVLEKSMNVITLAGALPGKSAA